MRLGVGIAEPARFRRPPELSAVHAPRLRYAREACGLPLSSTRLRRPQEATSRRSNRPSRKPYPCVLGERRHLSSAEVSELGKVPGIFDVGRCRIAMHDDRLILRESTTSFIVAPDALCFRVRRRAAEDTAEHL